MDIFAFTGTTSPTKLEHGEIVNGLVNKLWIERYREAGEFKLIANPDSGVREQLPMGSLISHTGSTEVMVVENHEIVYDQGVEGQLIVTGRGFETFLENRIIGSNKVFPVTTGSVDYTLSAEETWNQAVTLISDHILASYLIDDNSALEYISVLTNVADTIGPEERVIKKGPLYSRLLDLLAIDQLGIKIVRPGAWSPLGPTSPNMAILIHSGANRASDILFSYSNGEIESADYLWSCKKRKNTAMVTGRWVETVVTTALTHYDRRMMYVEVTDIDNSFETAPVGADLTTVIAAMQQRGIEALASQNDIALTKAQVSRDTNRNIYREDFDVGDIVTVDGDYNQPSYMQITEYVEIEDETGSHGYPTLAVVQ